MHMANALARKVEMEVHAQCTPPLATALLTAARSRSSRSRDVKTLRREVLSVKPGVPKAAPHQRWMNTTISFGPSDCPENMAGAGVLPLVTAPVISNVRLYHVLIDGGAGLNIISYAAFKQL